MGGKKKEIKEPDVAVPDGDAKMGKSIFEEQCSTCHALSGDGKGAAAPPLNGLFGRQAGSTAFASSKSLKSSGIVWSAKHLYMYLLNPGKYIPGNKMSFAGLASEADRAHVCAYLAEISG